MVENSHNFGNSGHTTCGKPLKSAAAEAVAGTVVNIP